METAPTGAASLLTPLTPPAIIEQTCYSEEAHDPAPRIRRRPPGRALGTPGLPPQLFLRNEPIFPLRFCSGSVMMRGVVGCG